MVGSPLIQNLKTRDDGRRLWEETAAALYNKFEQFAHHPISCGSIGLIWLRLHQDATEQNRCCLTSAAPSTANKPLSRFCYGFVTVLSSELQGYVQPIVANQVLSDSGFGCYHCCIETGCCGLSPTGLAENKFPVPGRLHPCD
jgi:hypothetical protein